MRKITVILHAFFVLIYSCAFAQAPSGEEVLRRIDENLVIEQAISQSTMIIHNRSGDRTITSKSWIKGKNRGLVEYLSPAREQGKKMLRLGDQIWIYTPEPTDRIITISGHLLRQSVMGSDLSYEDMTENDKLIEQYDAVVEGEDEVNGRRCYILRLTAKREGVTYQSRALWVDAERWLPLREERFAKSGKLLKTTEIVDVFQADARWYPKKIIFKDMLSRGQGTEYLIDAIDFNADVPDYLLTKAALRK